MTASFPVHPCVCSSVYSPHMKRNTNAGRGNMRWCVCRREGRWMEGKGRQGLGKELEGGGGGDGGSVSMCVCVCPTFLPTC